MKKMVALLLALVMCLSLTATSFAAYNDHTDYVDWPLVKDGENMTVKVTTRRSVQYGKDPEDQWFWQWSEKFSGIDFDVEQVLVTSWGEKKSLMFASGDLPDVLFLLQLTTSDLVRYGMGEGLLLDLKPYITPEIMPNLCKWIEEYPEMIANCTTPDGKIYTLPGVSDLHMQGNGATTMEINHDWLKEAGLEEPKTLDEFTAMLYKFKEMRPDCIPLGSGAKNVTENGGIFDPRTYIINAIGYVSPDPSAIGVNPSVRNGQCVIPAYDDTYVEVLRVMNEYYTNGLISPDFFILDNATAKAQLAEDMVGAYPGCAYYALPEPEGFTKWVENSPLTSQWNNTPQIEKLSKFHVGWCSLSADIDPKKIETVLKYLDAFYTDLLGMYMWCGPAHGSIDCIDMIGGYVTSDTGSATWLDKDGNQMDSQAFMEGDAGGLAHGFGNRSNPLDPEVYGKGVTCRPEMRTYYYNADNVVPYKYDPTFGAQYLLMNVTKNVEPYRVDSYPFFTYYDEETTLAIEELHTILDPYIESETAKFITGARSLDEFPQFQSELKKMGIDELLGYYCSSYASYVAAQQ